MNKLYLKRFLFLLSIHTCVLLFAQNTIPTSTTDYLFEKADSFTYIHIDSALYYANSALNLAEKAHNTTSIFKAYRTIGYIYEENSRFVEAQKAYKNALDLAENQLSDYDKCAIYTDWAIIHKKMGQYLITQDYHWRTLKIAEKIGNWELVENGYNGLGTLFAMMSDYEKSISYYLKSIEAAEKWGNKMGVVITNENISSLYINAKNYELAERTIAKTYDLAQVSRRFYTNCQCSQSLW